MIFEILTLSQNLKVNIINKRKMKMKKMLLTFKKFKWN